MRELTGALGDLIWGLYLWPEANDPLLDILILADDHELLVQRLSLSGYRPEGLAKPVGSWRSPDGVIVRTLESQDHWALEALRAAMRNRDNIGAPHIPAAFLFVGYLTEFAFIDFPGERVFEILSAPEIHDIRALIKRLEPSALPRFELLAGPWNDDGAVLDSG